MSGVIAGLLGCVFGILGILTFGLIFVPLAVLCALIGLLKGLAGRSAAGIGTSFMAGVLAFIGFTVSPSLWLATALTVAATNRPANEPVYIPAQTAPTQQTEAPSAALVPAPALPTALASYSAAPPQSSLPLSAFDAGARDRAAFEAWFADTGGAFHDGADFWGSHRSDVPRPKCTGAQARDPQWSAGCREAQARLDPLDQRRKSDPAYRQGWNSIP